MPQALRRGLVQAGTSWLCRRRPVRDPAIGRRLDRADWGMAALVWVLTSALLLGFEAFLQNAHIGTTNGLWESIELRHWLADPRWAGLDPGNAIYLPVYGALCQGLRRLGIFPGVLWRQMAVLDAVFAGFGLAGVYLFVAAWLRERLVALLAVVLYGGSAFYLLCSILDEWDMPSQSFVLFATLLACAWFAQPTARRIAPVAILFSISWLFEWRFLFPGLPPLLLTLCLAPGLPWQRILRPIQFLFFMSLAPLALTAGYVLTGGATQSRAAGFLFRLFWAGKGTGTGWAGFAAVKFPLAAGGIAESLIGARNLVYGQWTGQPVVGIEILCGLILCLALLALALRYAWRHRNDDAVVLASLLLGGVLLTGTVFNLYSQPQDPQMLLNVMIWTVPAWALLAQAALGRSAPPTRWRRAAAPLLVALTLLPTAYNVATMAQARGVDLKDQRAVARLGRRFDPRRTVFLYQGFEGIVTWQFATWDGSWAEPAALPPAPSPRPTFKIIAAVGIPVHHPEWSAARQANELRQQIDAALDRGYQVVAGSEYLLPEHDWAASFLTVAPAAVPEAMRRMLEADFRLTPVYDDKFLGTYAIVSRKARRER